MKEYVLDDGYVGNGKSKPIKYVLGGDNGDCYICTSHAKNPNEYYKIRRIKLYDMHLWIHNVFHGQIEKGLVVRHICNNRACINPNHLTSGTRKENSQDMLDANTEKKFLTEDEVIKIKIILNDGSMKQHEIAKMFGVHSNQISRINKGRTWSSVQI